MEPLDRCVIVSVVDVVDVWVLVVDRSAVERSAVEVVFMMVAG